ncbi:MAG: hypothetical protein Q8O99_01650 [bacterium]|nr:hypothetical protein [bacterium]
MTKDYNDILKIIGRSRGIPIAMFAGHSDQANKVISILDYIGKKA